MPAETLWGLVLPKGHVAIQYMMFPHASSGEMHVAQCWWIRNTANVDTLTKVESGTSKFRTLSMAIPRFLSNSSSFSACCTAAVLSTPCGHVVTASFRQYLD